MIVLLANGLTRESLCYRIQSKQRPRSTCSAAFIQITRTMESPRGVKRRRNTFEAGFKLKVIKFAEENGGNRAAGRHFDVSESNIRAWRKEKEELQHMPKSKRARRYKETPYKVLESELSLL